MSNSTIDSPPLHRPSLHRLQFREHLARAVSRARRPSPEPSPGKIARVRYSPQSPRERASERMEMFEWAMRAYKELREPLEPSQAVRFLHPALAAVPLPHEPLEWDVSVGTSTEEVFGPPDFVPPVRATWVWSSAVRRRPRSRRSHRVMRAVAKTAGGDSGDGDPEPEPPGNRRYLPAEVAP